MRDDSERHLTLALPGLFGPAVSDAAEPSEAARVLAEGLSPPALERFFARCSQAPAPPSEEGLAAMVFACFGVVRDAHDWPVAAVTRGVDAGDSGNRWVLRADPVHLRPAMGDLVLTDSAELDVSTAEAAALAAEINDALDEPGFRIEPLAAKRWYLHFDAPLRLVTRAPWDVVGTSIGASLPGGEEGARWRARINDVQMILHASPVNRAREGRGEPVVNSIWPWGGGYAPRVPGGVWQAVWSAETLAAGLARLAGSSSETLPDDAHGWLEGAAPGRHLLVFTEGHVAARSSDVDRWRRFIVHLETEWMAPLGDALASGGVASIELRTGGSRTFRLARRPWRHWWRRPLPFARVLASGRRLAAQPK